MLEQRTQVLLGDTPKAATEAAEEKQRLKSQIINDKTAEYAAGGFGMIVGNRLASKSSEPATNVLKEL